MNIMMSKNIIYPDTSSLLPLDINLPNQSIQHEYHNLSAISGLEDILIARNDDSSILKHKFQEFFDYVKKTELNKNQYTPNLFFSDDIKEEMYQKESFLMYISEIERSLFIFSNLYKISFKAEIHFQQDWEIKQVNNIIIQLKFYNISFKEQMGIWRQISYFIRKILKVMNLNCISEGEIEKYLTYNKNLYIKLDL